MTAFLIVLVIVLTFSWLRNSSHKQQHFSKVKSLTSNAKLEYDIGCNILVEMSERYREYASESYLNNEEYLRKAHPLERQWIICTAKAMGIFKNNLFVVQDVYSSRVWDMLPDKINDAFIKQFKNKFLHFNKSKDQLIEQLSESIKLKNQIMGIEKDSSYEAYKVKDICDSLALTLYKLPTREEYCKVYPINNYDNLNSMALEYAMREIKRKGYCALGLRPHVKPSSSLKMKKYNAKSNYEEQKLKEQEKTNIIDKLF